MTHKVYTVYHGVKYLVMRIKTLCRNKSSGLEKKLEEPRKPRYVGEFGNGIKVYIEHDTYLGLPYQKQIRYKRVDEKEV